MKALTQTLSSHSSACCISSRHVDRLQSDTINNLLAVILSTSKAATVVKMIYLYYIIGIIRGTVSLVLPQLA